MIFSEVMGRETSDRDIVESSAGPLESLVGPHAAIEVAISARELLEIAISSRIAPPHIEKHTSRHSTARLRR